MTPLPIERVDLFPYLQSVPERECERADGLVDGVVARDACAKHDHID